MTKPLLDREKQVQQIITSAPYQSGEVFTTPVIAALLNLTVAQARDLLNHMVVFGQAVKRQERARQGGKRTGTTLYQKPPPMILRKAWRFRSDEAIGITP
jgi:hypothetical protein